MQMEAAQENDMYEYFITGRYAYMSWNIRI